ncbi:hypothetical protein GGX14DRAFT_610063 [Mycena pura]|uniref:Uncharacterized protein n=1 Tax=Mycena pura TaxID=153505 RepID=A0AAD6VJX6_9AGAR|nr:hypothetical protein GGX14DRAFT_610063 [Mycena pura]
MNSAFALFELLFTNSPPAPWLPLPILLGGYYLGGAYIRGSTVRPAPSLSRRRSPRSHRRRAAYFPGPASGGVHRRHRRAGGACVVFLLARGAVLRQGDGKPALDAYGDAQRDDGTRGIQIHLDHHLYIGSVTETRREVGFMIIHRNRIVRCHALVSRRQTITLEARTSLVIPSACIMLSVSLRIVNNVRAGYDLAEGKYHDSGEE